MIDYYKILGISHSAKIVEIRKAYRSLALKLHPDVNDSASAKEEFIQINKAYSVLKNVYSKSRYDKIYRVYILNETAENENRFQKKRDSRTRSYSRKSKGGEERAEAFSKKSDEEFKQKQKKSRSWDGFWFLVEAIVNLLGIFP